MSTMYDIIISLTISGFVLVMLVSFNGNISEEGIAQTVKNMTQSNLTEVTRDLEYMVRKMGYGVTSPPDSSIILADSNKITFKGDFDNNGKLDTVTYYLNPSAASGQSNTNTRILYYTYNKLATRPINIGITRFRLFYFDSSGTPFTTYPVAARSKIKSFKIALNLESIVPYKVTSESYTKLNPGVYWERVFKPRNLR